MRDERSPYPSDGDETIAPDIARRGQEPLMPADAVRRERDKYGESSLDENRDDQLDEHHADLDDIV